MVIKLNDMSNIVQQYAWQFYAGHNDKINVRSLDWAKGYFQELEPGESVTTTQNRFIHCAGDNSETLENIGGGFLRLTRRMGEGCGQRVETFHI